MKHVAAAFIAVAVVFLTGTGLKADSVTDLVERLATSQKGSISQGDTYAHDLYRALTVNGVEAYWIQFRWGYMSPREYHADFIVFKDGLGHFWARQSTSLQSKWISGKTPEDWLYSYWGHYLGLTGKPLSLQMASVSDNRQVVNHPMLKANYATLMASADSD